MKNVFKSLVIVCVFLLGKNFIGQSKGDQSDIDALLINGGFESGAPVDFGSITGWEVFGNEGALPVGYTRTEPGFVPEYLPEEGQRMALFSAGNNDFGGEISQAFQTIPGATYQIKFKLGIVTEAIGRRQAVQLSVANGEGALILSRIETIASPGIGTTWSDINVSFIAPSTLTRITIADQSEIFPISQTYNSDLLIDSVSVSVQKSANNSPSAVSQNVSVTQDDFVAITLTGLDPDFGNVLSYRVVSSPSHGTLGGAAPNLVYTPAAGYVGPDSFTFSTSDVFSESPAAIINIDVKGAEPLANGSFELGNTLEFGAPDGWRISGRNLSKPTSYISSDQGAVPSYKSSDGNHMLVFSNGDNDFGGSISQRFATVPGQAYRLRYDMGVVSDTQGRQQAMGISLYGSSSQPLINRTETIQSQGPFSFWLPKLQEFVADGPTVLLTFFDQSGIYSPILSSNTDLLLDRVSIVAASDIEATPLAQSQSVEVFQNASIPIVLQGSSGVANEKPGFLVISPSMQGSLTGNPPNIVYTPKSGFMGLDEFEFVTINGTKQSQSAKVSINVIKKVYKFEQWMATFGSTGSLDANPDKDGMVNGVEYVLGANPVKKTGSNFLPKSRISNEDPDGDGKKNRYLVYSFRRTQESASDPNVAILIEWRSNGKEVWKDVTAASGVVVKTQSNRFGIGVDLVNVYIPRSITKSPRLSTRLRVIAKQ